MNKRIQSIWLFIGNFLLSNMTVVLLNYIKYGYVTLFHIISFLIYSLIAQVFLCILCALGIYFIERTIMKNHEKLLNCFHIASVGFIIWTIVSFVINIMNLLFFESIQMSTTILKFIKILFVDVIVTLLTYIIYKKNNIQYKNNQFLFLFIILYCIKLI